MIDRRPLPAAVRLEKHELPEEVRTKIQALNGARPREFTLELIWAWAVIFGAILGATAAHSVWVSVIAIVIVATRQNVLGLLVHEQAHRLGYRHKFGDLLVNLFCAYPLLVLSVENYAQVHLAHHKFYFLDNDPDFVRKNGPDWSFPNTAGHLLRLFATDLVGLNTIKLVRGKREVAPDYQFARPFPTPTWVRFAYFLLAAAVLTVTNAWIPFAIYWLLPILTVSQAIVRWGAICEHKYNIAGARVADTTPLILLSWWERLLLPNLNFAMHPYHHYFPGVAFSNLPKVHAIYEREGLLNEANLFLGYGAYWRYLIGKHQVPNV
jgi:fatty acid desaturase